MPPRLFAPILLLAFLFSGTARADELVGDWINGNCVFYSTRLNDSIYLFEGGDYHEGGSSFVLLKKSDGRLFLMGAKWSGQESYADLKTPSIGESGDKVLCKVIAGIKLLIIYGPMGHIQDFLLANDAKKDLHEQYFKSKTKFELSGKYADRKTDREVIFYPDVPEVKGLTAARERYEIQTSYDYPVDVFKLGNGKTYYYDKTDSGLEIYTAKPEPGDDDKWIRGSLLLSLRKVEWFSLCSKPELKGRYAFASTDILTYDMLRCFTANERRIMRNEIYARYGYVFKAADLDAYFRAQSWYVPNSEAGENNLTELEKFNIQLLVGFDQKLLAPQY